MPTQETPPKKRRTAAKAASPPQEVVVLIPLAELHPFPDNPYAVRDDAAMQATAESIKEYGVLTPAIIVLLTKSRF